MLSVSYDTGDRDFAFLDALETPIESPLRDIRQLSHRTTRRLFGWWSAWVSEHAAPPRRTQFDILQFLPEAANLYLAAKDADGNWNYRVRGEKFLRIFGPAEHGERASLYHYRPFPLSVADYLERVALEGSCRCTKGTLRDNASGLPRFESLDCPLLDDSGQPHYMIGAAVLH